MDQELFARFKKCAVEVLSVDESAVVPEAKFGDDLDADSLDLVENCSVGSNGCGLSALLTNLSYEAFEGFTAAGCCDDFGAFSCEAERRLAPHPRGGAEEYDHLFI